MAPENVYSVNAFKRDLADMVDRVKAGHVVYVRNDRRRGSPVVAALVSVADAEAIEHMHANAAQAP